MLSFHEKWFERRWYGFKPRTKRVAVIAFTTFAVCLGLAFAALVLGDAYPWARWLAAPIAVVLVIYNTLGLSRTDN